MAFTRIILFFSILLFFQSCLKEHEQGLEVRMKLDSHKEKIAFRAENIEFPFYFLQSNYPNFFNFDEYKFDESQVEYDTVYFTASYFDYYKSIIHFKGINKNNLDTIKILEDKYNFDFGKESEKKEFSMLTAVTGFSKQQQFLVVDVNRNKNLNEESIYYKEKNYFKSKANLRPIIKYRQSFYQKNQLENYERLIEIKPYTGNYFYHKMKDTIAKKVALIGELKDYWKGEFKIGKNKYEIAAQGFNTKKLEFLIKKQDLKFSSISEYDNTDFRYKMYDTLVVNSVALRIDTVLKDGNGKLFNLKLEKVDNFKAKDFGFRTNQKIGNIELLSLDKELVQLNKLSRGSEYTLIYFWGTWCKPCRESTNSLIELHHKYSDSLQILGVAYEKNIETLLNYKKEIPWTNFFVEKKYNPNSILQKLHIDGFPSFILIDSEGIILHRGSEVRTIEKIQKIISKK